MSTEFGVVGGCGDVNEPRRTRKLLTSKDAEDTEAIPEPGKADGIRRGSDYLPNLVLTFHSDPLFFNVMLTCPARDWRLLSAV